MDFAWYIIKTVPNRVQFRERLRLTVDFHRNKIVLKGTNGKFWQ